jgi:hypothetical protein
MTKTPTTGTRITVTLHNGDKITGRVDTWPRSGQVRLSEPVNIFPKFSVKEWRS